MEGTRPRVSFAGLVLLAALVLLGVAPPIASSCKNVSGVDLCETFQNASGCDCDIVDVSKCLVHITCDGNATYRGPVPDFSQLERHNYSLLL